MEGRQEGAVGERSIGKEEEVIEVQRHCISCMRYPSWTVVSNAGYLYSQYGSDYLAPLSILPKPSALAKLAEVD